MIFEKRMKRRKRKKYSRLSLIPLEGHGALRRDTANNSPPGLDSATNTLSGLSFETFLKLNSPDWRAKVSLGANGRKPQEAFAGSN